MKPPIEPTHEEIKSDHTAPWYHGAKWMVITIKGYGFDQIVDPVDELVICDVDMLSPQTELAEVGGYGKQRSGKEVSYERLLEHGKLIAAAPETATERDNLKSQLKIAVEALEMMVQASSFILEVQDQPIDSWTMLQKSEDEARSALQTIKEKQHD